MLKRLFSILALSTVFLLVVACGDTSSPQPTISPIQPTTQPTTQPTQPVTSISTIAPASGPALLGALIGTFVTKYGQPTNGDTFGNLNITFDNNRAIAILDNAPDSGWNRDTALAACLSFAPLDNTYKRQMTLLNPDGSVLGIQRVYFSASLAPLLPASDFTDEHGNADAPGTFGIVLNLVAGSSSQYDSCAIQAGLQQV